jgi:hypothetical protein
VYLGTTKKSKGGVWDFSREKARGEYGDEKILK